MSELWRALLDPDLIFLRYSFLLGLLASVSFGVIGSFVVARRIGYMAGGISHCVLGGIGLGLYLNRAQGADWAGPVGGAFAAALAAAVVIGLIGLYWKEREDTLIGLLWSAGMSLGLIFIELTPGYFNLMSFLFGDILLVSATDIWAAGVLDLLILAVVLVYFNRLLATCFDPEFATLRGIRPGAFYMLMLCLTALTVVLMVRIVGIVLVIALLTIPAAAAGRVTRSLRGMMVVAGVFCLLATWGGLAGSFIAGQRYGLNLSSGPVIVCIAGALYLLAVAAGYALARLRRG